jgi:hypothetical protein
LQKILKLYVTINRVFILLKGEKNDNI